jgi:hypothetical protein
MKGKYYYADGFVFKKNIIAVSKRNAPLERETDGRIGLSSLDRSSPARSIISRQLALARVAPMLIIWHVTFKQEPIEISSSADIFFVFAVRSQETPGRTPTVHLCPSRSMPGQLDLFQSPSCVHCTTRPLAVPFRLGKSAGDFADAGVPQCATPPFQNKCNSMTQHANQ